MKRFLLVALIIPFLFIGCSHSINSEYNENNLNSISYAAKNKYARAAVNNVNPLLHIDIYKAPVLLGGWFDYDNKEFIRTEVLKYGEEKEIERCSETGYIYIINCQEYPFACAWYGYKNELNFFEYENDIVLQKVMHFYNGPNYGVEYQNNLSQFAYSNGDGKYFTYNFFGENRVINCKKYIKEYYGDEYHFDNYNTNLLLSNDLDEVLTIDIYKVSCLSNGRYDFNNKVFIKTETLNCGEEKEVSINLEDRWYLLPICKKYYFQSALDQYKNELSFFKYKNSIVMKKTCYYSGRAIITTGVNYGEGLKYFTYLDEEKYSLYVFFGNDCVENCKKYIEEYYQ